MRIILKQLMHFFLVKPLKLKLKFCTLITTCFISNPLWWHGETKRQQVVDLTASAVDLWVKTPKFSGIKQVLALNVAHQDCAKSQL